MKTSVSELQFDIVGTYSGDYPLTYKIRIEDEKSERHGDLMSRYLIDKLERYGDKVINFPKKLLEEIYDDCCFAYFTRLATLGNSTQIFSVTKGYVDTYRLEKICQAMGLRLSAKIEDYMLSLDECQNCDEYEEIIQELKDTTTTIKEDYERTGDWILNLKSQEDLVGMTLILLNLRRDLWRASPKYLRGNKDALIEHIWERAAQKHH